MDVMPFSLASASRHSSMAPPIPQRVCSGAMKYVHLCSLGKGRHRIMWTQEPKTQYPADRIFGRQEGVAFGHLQEEPEERVRNRRFGISGEGVLYIMVEDVYYRLSVLSQDRFQIEFHHFPSLPSCVLLYLPGNISAMI